MNVKQMVKERLLKDGFDGLYNTGNCAGCRLEDLFSCSKKLGYPEECFPYCIPGYLIYKTSYNWRIGPKPPTDKGTG